MGPSTSIGSIYRNNYGPIQIQQQLLFEKQWAIHMYWELPQKLWAYPHLLAASMVKIMDPFKFSGSLYLKINGPTHKHFMGPILMQLAAATKIMGPSKFSSSIYYKNNGPIQYYCQHHLETCLGPSNAIGRTSQNNNGPIQ
jgi:hypothetical protein